KASEARLQYLPTLGMSTAKLLAEYPQPKQAQKQAAKQTAKQTQADQRRSDAKVGTAAGDMLSKDMQAPPPEEVEEESTQLTQAMSDQEDPNATAPMKQDPSLQGANLTT